MELVLDTMVERVGRVRAGNGLEDGVGVGPLVDDRAVAKVERQVEDARERGARVLVGGRRLTDGALAHGHFYAPTLVADVDDTMLVRHEETFGPLAPVLTYGDVDELVAEANRTEYGLAAYVYTDDLSAAIRTVEGLRFGIIGVNDVSPTQASVPFGGMGASGLGREGGPEGIAEYLETKAVGLLV